MEQQRRQQISQLVEACEMTDNSDLEIEKTGVIRELLAELEQHERDLETEVEEVLEIDFDREIAIEHEKEIAREIEREIMWDFEREIERDLLSQMDFGYQPDGPEIEMDIR